VDVLFASVQPPCGTLSLDPRQMLADAKANGWILCFAESRETVLATVGLDAEIGAACFDDRVFLRDHPGPVYRPLLVRMDAGGVVRRVRPHIQIPAEDLP
jgi:hypothetical protein